MNWSLSHIYRHIILLLLLTLATSISIGCSYSLPPNTSQDTVKKSVLMDTKGLFRTGVIEADNFYETVQIKSGKLIRYPIIPGDKPLKPQVYPLTENEIHTLNQLLVRTGATNWKRFYNDKPDLKEVGHKWSIQYKSGDLLINSGGHHTPPENYIQIYTYVFDTLTRNKPEIKPAYAVEGHFLTATMEARTSIKIQNKKLLYEKYKRGNNSVRTYYLTNLDISNLEKRLTELGAINWKKRYRPSPLIVDGHSWSLTYKSSNLNINSGGSNAYPQFYKKIADYLLKELIKGKQFR